MAVDLKGMIDDWMEMSNIVALASAVGRLCGVTVCLVDADQALVESFGESVANSVSVEGAPGKFDIRSKAGARAHLADVCHRCLALLEGGR